MSLGALWFAGVLAIQFTKYVAEVYTGRKGALAGMALTVAALCYAFMNLVLTHHGQLN
jgi:hypothetical protein